MMTFPPAVPPMQPPANVPAPSPMIYISQGPAWEYKQIVRDLSAEKLPTDAELNALGRDGWELVTVISRESGVYFYFKRTK